MCLVPSKTYGDNFMSTEQEIRQISYNETMQASQEVAVFLQPGLPVEIREELVKQPKEDEILVRVLLAGICGSDFHRIRGDIKSSGPICFGHEAVGKIEHLGKEIVSDRAGTTLDVGDYLYWVPSTPCGICSDCKSSNPLRCKDLNWPPSFGPPNGAGFRQLATISKKSTFVRIPPQTSLESVIAFGCAMPTALRGLSRLESITEDDTVVIQGSGPVGLACTVLVGLRRARKIIVIGDPPHRLDMATMLGATDTMSLSDTTLEGRLASVLRLSQDGSGATVVIEAAGAPAAFSEGLNFLGRNGQLLILGLYSGHAPVMVDPVRINNLNQVIVGSLGIEVSNYAETVEIATDHGARLGLDKMVTHRYPLRDLERAIQEVGKGIPIKAVITPNSNR